MTLKSCPFVKHCKLLANSHEILIWAVKIFFTLNLEEWYPTYSISDRKSKLLAQWYGGIGHGVRVYGSMAWILPSLVNYL